MNAVTVEPGSVGEVARSQAAVADQVRAQAQKQRLDTAPLVPVFGLIGAEFLGTLADVCARRAQALDTAATMHHSTSNTAIRAATDYQCCDAASARSVSA